VTVAADQWKMKPQSAGCTDLFLDTGNSMWHPQAGWRSSDFPGLWANPRWAGVSEALL